MLSLDHSHLIAERLGLDSDPHTVANGATNAAGPKAWDSHLADAMCHLLSGFLIVEDVGGASSRTLCGPATTLEVIASNLSRALQELNECSLKISLGPQARVRKSVGLRAFCRRINLWRDPTVHRPFDVKPRDEILSEFLTERSTGAYSAFAMKPEWDERLAAALLHLVGAYRAMELLSTSPLPAGAPRSFGVACHCLCTALEALDRCVSSCDD